MTDAYGISDQLTALIERHGAEAVADEMPGEWLEDLTLAGTPAEVVAKMRRWLEGGLASICIFWPDPELEDSTFQHVAEQGDPCPLDVRHHSRFSNQ
jgi:alkanesulfonate monooxygenase SsuD/methylene tetrahydromethanopterin reductase-like flavin-dependent oxidoreductase (luciferase family)